MRTAVYVSERDALWCFLPVDVSYLLIPALSSCQKEPKDEPNRECSPNSRQRMVSDNFPALFGGFVQSLTNLRNPSIELSP